MNDPEEKNAAEMIRRYAAEMIDKQVDHSMRNVMRGALRGCTMLGVKTNYFSAACATAAENEEAAQREVESPANEEEKRPTCVAFVLTADLSKQDVEGISQLFKQLVRDYKGPGETHVLKTGDDLPPPTEL